MAAFSTLALAGAAAGAGLLGGSLLGRKKKQNQDQTLAPGATNANQASTPEPVAPPSPPIVNPGDQNAAAQQAGAKQRKRAAAGSLLTMPKAPASSTPRPGARYSRPTLLGS